MPLIFAAVEMFEDRPQEAIAVTKILPGPTK